MLELKESLAFVTSGVFETGRNYKGVYPEDRKGMLLIHDTDKKQPFYTAVFYLTDAMRCISAPNARNFSSR